MTSPPGGLAAVGGWAGAYGLAVVVAVVFSRGRPGRQTAWMWTGIATAFPGAWITLYTLAPAVSEWLAPLPAAFAISALGYSGLLWLTGVLVAAGQGAWTEDAPPLPTRAPAVRPTTQASPATRKRSMVPKAKPPLPTIRSAGAVASGAPRGGGSGRAVERDGLIRVLTRGPDFQTTAAAKGLAVAWADTRDPATVNGLIDVLRRADVTAAAGAEVWIALRAVAGDAPDWDESAEIRRTFPDCVDWETVDALDVEVH